MKKVALYVLYFGIILIIIMSMSRWRIVSLSNKYIFDANESVQIKDCQTIVVLGAKVHDDGSMSTILKERVMATVELYEKEKICHIIITGYDDEVMPVKIYLIKMGVPENIIVTDSMGKDTFTSMKNIRDILDVHNIVIVTQAFHLPRAVYIARVLGFDASGFVAYKYPYPSTLEKYKDIAREWPAAVKAVWQSELLMINE